MTTSYKSYANIALMKYWGKRDEKLVLPTTSSVAMTLDALYTITSVTAHDLKEDIFVLNGEVQSDKERLKVSRFIDLFRDAAQSEQSFYVESKNNFPTAAGLASSASGFAALAGALNHELALNMNDNELSRFARQGSGSASRSLHGGFVAWDKGTSHEDSHAYQVDAGNWDIQMMIVICNDEKKPFSSRDLMKKTQAESIFYDAWVQESHRDFEKMIEALQKHDFTAIGKLSRKSAWQMHATLLGLKEPFHYLQSSSFKVFEVLAKLRLEGIEVYESMDAGPNVKILVQKKNIERLKEALSEIFEADKLILSQVGPRSGVIKHD